jgi:2-oxoglutarate ferredoxin oxidoreductase subunit alpha
VRHEWIGPQEYDLLLVAYGTAARICYTARLLAEKKGLRAALLRPISLYPFPAKAIADAAKKAKVVLVVEMSLGQMVEDVERAVTRHGQVRFFGHSSGVVPTPEEVLAAMEEVYANNRG